MDVLSLGPLRATSLVWQPRRGAWALTVVCKATYLLTPNESPLAPEQEYPNEDDNHWNDDPARSLYSPTDLVPFKPHADVTLVGHAFAPRGEPVRSLVARMIVGEVDKAIEVYGERTWTMDGILREGARFVKMPLRYERASGGPDTQNPVGVRLDARPDAFGNVPVPNLQPPGLMLSDPKDYLEPIGFGPIAPAWPIRRDRLGRHAGVFVPGAWQEQPLPEDLDPGYFNAAPRDQQTESLRPNERLVLENLHPEHPRLVTNLAGVSPKAFVERRGAPPQELALTCDTLWIDTDRAICTLTWRGQVALEHPGAPGRVLIAAAEPGQRLTWADVERLARGGLEHTETDAAPRAETLSSPPTFTGDAAPSRPSTHTLPFVAASTFAKALQDIPKPPRPTLEPRRNDGLDEVTNIGALAPSAGLPFGGGSRDGAARDDADAAQKSAGDASPPWLSSSRIMKAPPGLPKGPPPPPPSFGTPPPLPAAAKATPPPLPSKGPPPPPPMIGPPVPPPPAMLGTSQPPQISASAPPSLQNAPPPLSSPIPSFQNAPPPLPAAPPPFQNAPPPLPVAPPSLQSAPPPLPVAPPHVQSAPPPLPVAPPHVQSAPPPLPAAPPHVQSAPPPLPAAPPPIQNAFSPISAAPPAGSTPVRGTLPLDDHAPSAPPPLPPPRRPEPSLPPSLAPEPPRSAPHSAKEREIVEILGLDPAAIERARAHPAIAAILGRGDGDGRRMVGELLARRAPLARPELDDLLDGAVGEDGLFAPPLAVVAGDLTLAFDPLDELRATVAAASPIASREPAIEEARRLLDGAGLRCAGAIARDLTARIQRALAETGATEPSRIAHELCEQRRYVTRMVFGAPCLQAALTLDGDPRPVPTYVPELLGARLPMLPRFRVRMIVAVHLPQQEAEHSGVALEAIALARTAPRSIRAR